MPAVIQSEETPNPNSRRFTVDRTVQEQPKGRFFTSAADAQEPLVRSLFAIDGVASVMLLPHSITIGKDNAAAWDDIETKVQETIAAHFA